MKFLNWKSQRKNHSVEWGPIKIYNQSDDQIVISLPNFFYTPSVLVLEDVYDKI
jgi:hypothetical protein